MWTCCQVRCQAVQGASAVPAPQGFASSPQGRRGCREQMHRPPPILGGSEQPLVDPTGLLQVIVTSSYANWYGDVWCCYDTLPAFESAPMSTRLYMEWMIPPKCILEFCTNTFSELSKQCRPLSRCIVYAFFFLFNSVAGMSKWVREQWSEQQQEEQTARERERDRDSLPHQKTSAPWTARVDFPFRQHFPFTCWTDR